MVSNRVLRAGALAAQFSNKLAAWRASPEVYRRRAYHEAVRQAIAPARKYVLSTTNANEQYWLNLEDKFRQDLLDIPLPTPIQKEAKKNQTQ